MIKIGDEIEVKIDKMVNRGKGLARVNDQVIFVPYSAPDDVLKVKVLKVSKNFVDAEIIEILKPSRIRVAAPCPYYTECGGCNFQHIEYPKQVEIKDNLVKETLQRALGIKESDGFLPPIYSPKPWNYRNRIQIHIENNKFGFIKRNSNTIVPIETCLIAEPALNAELLTFENNHNLPKLDKVELLLDKNLTVHHRDLNTQGQPVLFSQINRFANEVLVDLVVSRVLGYNPKARIYDLYSGDGNFLIAIAGALKERECVGVEMNPELVKLGRIEIANLKLKAKYILSNVKNFVESVSFDASDIIILDPPRIGCDAKTMMVLGSAPREKVIYISCEPTTLARDLKLVQETALRWGLVLKIDSVQTLDMFPQTEHIETVLEFSIDKIDTRKTTH